MSEKKVKTYTAEFKESAVKLAVESDQPATDTARDLGVNANTLHNWISKYHRPKASDTLDRDFQREQPNQAYVGDITYVPTREGWLYLSVFIDVCSRAVVGWSMSDRMTATLVTDSLEMAL